MSHIPSASRRERVTLFNKGPTYGIFRQRGRFDETNPPRAREKGELTTEARDPVLSMLFRGGCVCCVTAGSRHALTIDRPAHICFLKSLEFAFFSCGGYACSSFPYALLRMVSYRIIEHMYTTVQGRIRRRTPANPAMQGKACNGRRIALQRRVRSACREWGRMPSHSRR